MDDHRPLRAGLFFYECLRLLLLVVFIFMTSIGSGLNSRGFPYISYLSSNALFPMMTLFIWFRLEEHKNYLNLYMAGKVVALVSFYVWQIFSSMELMETENLALSTFLLWGSVIVSFADILSFWVAWTLKKILRRQIQP